MNELIEALRERMAEVREQIVYGSYLEKKARKLTKGLEEKIEEMSIKMEAQRRMSEYAIRSLENIQKRYTDLQIGALEKRLKGFEEEQARKEKKMNAEYSRVAGAAKNLGQEIVRKNISLHKRIDELNKNIPMLVRADLRLKEKLGNMERKVSGIIGKLRNHKPHKKTGRLKKRNLRYEANADAKMR